MANTYTLNILLVMIFLIVFLLLMIVFLLMQIYSIFVSRRLATSNDEEKALELPVHKNKKRVKISEEQARDHCSICLEGFVTKKREIVVLRHCEHMFHFPCIVEWTRESRSCPLCRQVVDRVVVSKIKK